MAIATSPKERAVALFAPGGDTAFMRAAIEAGVSAYVAEDVRPEVLRPVIDLAIAQFATVRRLRLELEATRRALSLAEPVARTVLVAPDHRRRMVRAVLGANGMAVPVLGLEEIDPAAELRLLGTVEAA